MPGKNKLLLIVIQHLMSVVWANSEYLYKIENRITMRISEKTMELNICAQINQFLNRRILWFGLTQKQEAKAGFDAATELNGRIFLFQFKASNNLLKNGARRFYLEHGQMQKLIDRAKDTRSIFYVFPLFGDTSELKGLTDDLTGRSGDFLKNTWVLDVSTLPNPFPVPKSIRYPYQVRKTNLHYADVKPPNVIIHSDPVEAKLESLTNIVKRNFAGSEGINEILFEYGKSYEKAFEILKPFRKNFMMAIIPDDVYEKYNL